MRHPCAKVLAGTLVESTSKAWKVYAAPWVSDCGGRLPSATNWALILLTIAGDNLTKTTRGKDGTERTHRLRPRKWFWCTPTDGGYRLQVLYGHRPLRLHQDNATVICADLEGVQEALQAVAQAVVLAGELDAALQAAQEARRGQ